jgi:hypothetical protein
MFWWKKTEGRKPRDTVPLMPPKLLNLFSVFGGFGYDSASISPTVAYRAKSLGISCFDCDGRDMLIVAAIERTFKHSPSCFLRELPQVGGSFFAALSVHTMVEHWHKKPSVTQDHVIYATENFVIHIARSGKFVIHIDRTAESMWMTEFSFTYMLWSCVTLSLCYQCATVGVSRPSQRDMD